MKKTRLPTVAEWQADLLFIQEKVPGKRLLRFRSATMQCARDVALEKKGSKRHGGRMNPDT